MAAGIGTAKSGVYLKMRGRGQVRSHFILEPYELFDT